MTTDPALVTSPAGGPALATRPASPRPGARGRRTLYYVAGVIVAALFLFPFVWTVLRSLQGSAAEGSAPSWTIIIHLTIHNYTGLLTAGGPSLWHFAGNSLAVAVATVVLSTVVAVLAGYGLARLPFVGAGVVFIILLTPFMVPFQALLTPLFIVLTWFHLTNSLVGLVLVYSAYQLPFSLYIMRNSFSALPMEIEEAAIIDGASPMAILWRVELPLVVPGVVTVALYAFLYGWNEFLGALMLLSSTNLLTLPVALNNLESGLYGAVNLGQLDAGAIIAMVPCLIVFLGLQRYYVRGLTAGAVK